MLVAAGIFCSRIAGLVRESVIAAFLGTSFAAEAYRVAMRIPNLLQNLLGEGVLSASFIPVYSRLLAEGRDEEAGNVAGAILGLLAALTGGLVLAGVLLAGPVTDLIAPGLSGERRDLTVLLVRILFPGVGFLVLSAWCLGILNSHRKFFLSYVAPVIWNVAQITLLAGAAWLVVADHTTSDGLEQLATYLAIGTTAGGVLQFAVQVPTVRKLEPGLRPSLNTSLDGVRRTLKAFVPVLGGRGVVQLSAFLDTLLASFLAAGALAALGYAQVLYLLPISLFGMSIAAAELPELSSMSSADRAGLRDRVRDGLRRVTFLVTGVVVVYLAAGGAFAQVLFERGQFGPDDRLLVWVVLGGYTIGLLASSASRLMQSALYGLGLAKFPARIAAVRVLVSLVLGATLMLQFDQFAITQGSIQLVGDLPATAPLDQAAREAQDASLRLGAVGLSLAAAVGAWLEFFLLRGAVAVRVGGVKIGRARVRALVFAGVASGLAAVGVTWLAGPDRGFFGAVAILAVAGVTYLAVSAALRIPELGAITGVLRR